MASVGVGLTMCGVIYSFIFFLYIVLCNFISSKIRASGDDDLQCYII